MNFVHRAKFFRVLSPKFFASQQEITRARRTEYLAPYELDAIARRNIHPEVIAVRKHRLVTRQHDIGRYGQIRTNRRGTVDRGNYDLVKIDPRIEKALFQCPDVSPTQAVKALCLQPIAKSDL
ncbi:hypothetical protein ATM17_30565 (plasmid) [Sphingopyxis macrogoltabida]|uniref:Uncharacterized protein n=1 Tax=Sphingopyxis macrogoltabida TaxID=33050 RepID=A0AAC9AZA6_SPHMC|nr:hypothetical protein ATM17_30565 [Sphingopyxis macrogoltabida]